MRILKQANQTIMEAYLKSLRQEGEPVKLKSVSKTQNGMFVFKTSLGSIIERTNLLVSIMSSRRFQDVFSVKVFRLPRRLQDVLTDAKLLHWRLVADIFKTNKCLLGQSILVLIINIFKTYHLLRHRKLAFWHSSHC